MIGGSKALKKNVCLKDCRDIGQLIKVVRVQMRNV